MAPARHGEPANPRIIGSRSGVHHGAPAGTLAFSSVMKVMHHAAMRRRMRTAMEVEMTNVPLAPSLIAFLAAAAPAASQPAQPQTGGATEESILVEGTRADPRAMVVDTINRAGVVPLARFEEKICPGVVGLAPAPAEKVLQLIRADVAALGGNLQKIGCTANATVIFTPEPAEFVKKLAVKQPGFFNFSPAGLKQFTATPRPVVSWHVTEVRDRDGNELGNSRELGMAKARILDQPAAAGAPMNARVLRNTGATHLYTSSREEMLFGFAVVDAARIQGKTMEQLAALATLHLMLDIKQNASANNPASILSLFDERPTGAAVPDGLSNFDRAMIEGLYRPQENNRSAIQQLSQIAAAVRKASDR
jgi:hypothetical protein